MKTTTFNQVIDGNTYTITMPQNRVCAVIARVDRFIEKKKFEKAFEAIELFIGAAPVEVEDVKENTPEVLIESNRSKGRHAVIAELMVKFNFNKSQAYYRTRKAGI